MPVSDYPDHDLLERAVRAARPRQPGVSVPRWAAVMDAFSLGSTYAAQLCVRFHLDPEEMLRGPSCGHGPDEDVGEG